MDIHESQNIDAAIPVPSVDERLCAAFCHLSIIMGLIVIPMLFALWASKKRKLFLCSHAKQALKFQSFVLALLIGAAVLGAISFAVSIGGINLWGFLMAVHLLVMGRSEQRSL